MASSMTTTSQHYGTQQIKQLSHHQHHSSTHHPSHRYYHHQQQQQHGRTLSTTTTTTTTTLTPTSSTAKATATTQLYKLGTIQNLIERKRLMELLSAPNILTSPTTEPSSKGLLNGPGQNNCFLNCAVQSNIKWKENNFRKHI